MPADQKPAEDSFGARLVLAFMRLSVKAASFLYTKKVIKKVCVKISFLCRLPAGMLLLQDRLFSGGQMLRTCAALL